MASRAPGSVCAPGKSELGLFPELSGKKDSYSQPPRLIFPNSLRSPCGRGGSVGPEAETHRAAELSSPKSPSRFTTGDAGMAGPTRASGGRGCPACEARAPPSLWHLCHGAQTFPQSLHRLLAWGFRCVLEVGRGPGSWSLSCQEDHTQLASLWMLPPDPGQDQCHPSIHQLPCQAPLRCPFSVG